MAAVVVVAVPLPDGRWLALSPESLQAALKAGAELGMGAAATVAVPDNESERWMNSEELGALLGVHSTTVESKAKSGEIPGIRIGKALRFEPAAVKAALKKRNQ